MVGSEKFVEQVKNDLFLEHHHELCILFENQCRLMATISIGKIGLKAK